MIIELLACLALAIIAYAIKRHFDDRKEARLVTSGIATMLEMQLKICSEEVAANTGLVRERLSVFEKALANAIIQFADIVKETRVSELDSRAKMAGQGIRTSRRMPTP